MKKYDLYLFDFDGTILNTMEALEYIFSVAYEHVGMKFDPKDTVEYARIRIDEGYYRMNGKPEKFMDFADYLHEAIDFPEALKRNEPYPDTYDFIDYVRKNHIKVGIVTSNKASHVKDVLNVMNIPIDTFIVYVGNKDYKNFKPHPDPIFKALELSGYTGDKSKVAYVGDALNDAISANAAGVDAIIIDRIDEYPDSSNYVRIHSLMDLFI